MDHELVLALAKSAPLAGSICSTTTPMHRVPVMEYYSKLVIFLVLKEFYHHVFRLLGCKKMEYTHMWAKSCVQLLSCYTLRSLIEFNHFDCIDQQITVECN